MLNLSMREALEKYTSKYSTLRYRIREYWRRQSSVANIEPIFVFGNQKSGTSAIAALLGEATGSSYTIDIFCRYQGLEEEVLRGRLSLEELIHKSRYYFSKQIIKDPGFTFFYNELCVQFPQSKKVFVLRDPRQNIRSILNRLNLPGDLYDLSSQQWEILKKEFPGWHLILDGELHSHKGKTYIETLALRCRDIFRIYHQHQENLTPAYYEEFYRDKEKYIQEIAFNLDLDVKQTIRHLKDRQFQPKGKPSVPLNVFYGFDNLKRIEDICGEEMLRIGYKL